MKFILDNISKIKTNSFVFLIHSNEELRKREFKEIEKLLDVRNIAYYSEDFKGKEYCVRTININLKKIILAGIGSRNNVSLEKIRRVIAKAVKSANLNSIENISVELYNNPELMISDIVQAETESIVLGLYNFNKYFTNKNEKDYKLKYVYFFSKCKLDNKTKSVINKNIKTAQITAEATNFARDLANEPSNILNPIEFAKIISERGRRNGYNVKILGKKEIEKLHMGCILGVSQGSKYEPKFVIMKYSGAGNSSKPVVFIGKGITFDSGGISLKPSSGMESMKMDMSGASSVVGLFEAVSKLKLEINIVGLIPLVENMPDAQALKPGDILRASNGITVEVNNTDAEGRLILADALCYAKKFNPKYVIDIATLTGAVIVALGNIASAVMGNDESLTKKIIMAGEQTHERTWEFPMWEEYEKLIESDYADVDNTGPPREAGTIIGGIFLKKFADNLKWAHIDIAGTAIWKTAAEYIPKNATGVGVRLLTRFIINEI